MAVICWVLLVEQYEVFQWTMNLFQLEQILFALITKTFSSLYLSFFLSLSLPLSNTYTLAKLASLSLSCAHYLSDRALILSPTKNAHYFFLSKLPFVCLSVCLSFSPQISLTHIPMLTHTWLFACFSIPSLFLLQILTTMKKNCCITILIFFNVSCVEFFSRHFAFSWKRLTASKHSEIFSPEMSQVR